MPEFSQDFLEKQTNINKGLLAGLTGIHGTLQKMNSFLEKYEEDAVAAEEDEKMRREQETKTMEREQLIKDVTSAIVNQMAPSLTKDITSAVVKQLVELNATKPVTVGGEGKPVMSGPADTHVETQKLETRTDQVQRPIQAMVKQAGDTHALDDELKPEGADEFPVVEEKDKEHPDVEMMKSIQEQLMSLTNVVGQLQKSVDPTNLSKMIRKESEGQLKNMGYSEATSLVNPKKVNPTKTLPVVSPADLMKSKEGEVVTAEKLAKLPLRKLIEIQQQVNPIRFDKLPGVGPTNAMSIPKELIEQK